MTEPRSARSVVICGSRTWFDYPAVRDRIARLDEDVTVIEGGAGGADTWANIACKTSGRPVRTFHADWSRGKRGGPERNRRMLDENPELVIAFQVNGSPGTQDTIDEARRRGIPVEVHTFSSALDQERRDAY